MARNYPRFIFSNPSNTKTPGPFIVHLLFPKMVLNFLGNDEWQINILDDCSIVEQNEIIEPMVNWFKKSYPEEFKKYPMRNVL